MPVVTNHQYEAPILPPSWTGDEKKFYTGLIDVLDEIYSKYGRLSLKDLSPAVRKQLSELVDNTTFQTVIEQTEREILLKADASTVDALGQTVSSHSTQIQQNASAIALKASQSSVAALEGRMSQAETSLTLKADQATLTSTANGLQSQIDAVPGKITLAINNVQVGGTNLLPHRADIWVQGSFLPDTGARNSGQTNRIRLIDGERITIVPGTEYIISRHTIGSTTYWLVLYAYDSNGNYVAADSITDWISTYPYTYTPTTATRLQIGMRHGDNSAITTAELVTSARFKIEKGNKATDWSPAPEDPASGVVNNSITIDTEGIKMSSSDVFQLVAANSSKNSYIDIHGLLTADNNGGLTAASGSFANTLSVGGQRVLTLADVGIPIKVSTSQPSGHGFVWLQPSSVTSVRYTGYTADSRNSTVMFSTSQRTITRSFAAEASNTLANGTFTYTLTFEVMSLSDAQLTGVTFSATATKGSTVSFSASSAITLTKYQTATITLTATSSTNLASNANAISVAITATASSYGGLYLNSKQWMTLTIAKSGGSGTQGCNVYYIP